MTDPVVTLGLTRNELLKKSEHLARQWNAAAYAEDPSAPYDPALDLATPVEDQADDTLLLILKTEEQIAETSATSPAGLIVKLQLLKDLCGMLSEQRDHEDYSTTTGIPTPDVFGEDVSEEDLFDDLGVNPSMHQNIKLLKKLAASTLEDAGPLLG